MNNKVLKKRIEILEHALVSSAGAFYNINLTKNIVPGEMYQVIDGKKFSINECIGMEKNVRFTDVVSYWGSRIKAEYREAFYDFLNIDNLIRRFENGEYHVNYTYWSQSVAGQPILVEKNIIMYRDDETGDILAVTYIIDKTKQYEIEQYNKKLEKSTSQLKAILKEEREYSLIVGAISKLYWQIFSVDILNDTYAEVYNGYDFNLNSDIYKGDNAQAEFLNILDKYVAEEYKELMRAFVNHKTLAARLSNTESVAAEFCTPDNMWFCVNYIVQERDADGVAIKVLYTLRIINERKQREIAQNERLKEAAVAADAANLSKSAFLYNMSHDIRTPLNGIIGLLEIDKAHFDDAKLVRENHDKMLVAADHLLSLINDVLQMSKLEDGTVEIECVPTDLLEVSKEVGTIIWTRTLEAGVTFEFGKQELPERYIYGSALHIRQIFLNIYGNCIKYNRPGGKIITSLECVQNDGKNITYRWTINDTGVGMEEDFVNHIFEPFVQEDKDARSIYHGTGLGMAIVKKLIDGMGGSISVSSKKDIGSTFVITLPFRIAPKIEEKNLTVTNEGIEGLKILLVEDNELNAEIAETILKDRGAVVTTVSNGAEAVDIFAEKPNETFDIILMDIMMPVMNGYEAAREIRRINREDAKTVPIIAMTANAFKEDEQKCINAGMNAHIAKPIDIKALTDKIAELKK